MALRFYKLILGVEKKATNLAVRGELGRYPIEIDMWHRSIKNFLRICNSNISGDCNNLLADCYLANHRILNHNLYQKSYLGSIKAIFLKLSYKEIWDNQFSKNSKITDNIRRSLKYYYKFSWEMAISNVDEKSKLRCYKQFKNIFEFEKYLLFSN